MTKKYLSREEILAISDIKVEEVYIPEWRTTVRVKTLSGNERDSFEASTLEIRGRLIKRNLDKIRAKLVSLSCVDEKGNRLFTDSDVEEIGKKNAAALDRIYTVAVRLSGISETDIEELAKNFDSDRKGSSTFS